MAAPQIIWFRQDLRLDDQAAIAAAAAAGPVVAVYVLDDATPGERRMGGASRWWLHHSLAALDAELRARGARLLLLRGRAGVVLPELAAAIGATTVHALHHYEPFARTQQAEVGKRLDLRLHDGLTLLPPHALTTGNGSRYRIFTPWWNACRAQMPPHTPQPGPARLTAAEAPAGDALADWGLLPTRPDWATGFRDWQPGTAGAMARLDHFEALVAHYDADRNFPAKAATSRLSPHLHFGEISPAQIWARLAARPHALPFLRQIGWRDFAIQTLDAFPDLHWRAMRPEFDRIAFTDVERGDGAAQLAAWQRGRTGYPIVDAGMRELWATGWMHNRVRMIAASFLTKHLLIDWRHGERWFWDTLVDADLANNAMGWQWVMGSGIDAAPYYRIFAPVGQSAKFDAAAYIRRWVPELAATPDKAIHAPWEHGGARGYPPPLIDHGFARTRVLAAFAAMKD
jgi:deoxyribodipyrimidine photo-lyase